MKRFIGANLPAVLVVLAVWKLLSLAYPPLVIPGLGATAGKLGEILFRREGLAVLATTALRLLAGLGLGTAAGIALGALAGLLPQSLSPLRTLIGLAQAVPPVSWLVLALMWFGFNGRPSVFIVMAATLPAVAVAILEGLDQLDRKLLAMGRAFHFSRIGTLRLIVVPSLLPHFRAGFRVALGIGCKAVIMGEILTTPTGVGGAIADARLNLEPETVAAWTLALLLLYWLLDRLGAALLRDREDGRRCS
ncbi:MAG: ABC transporter permease subunit [Planctomycetota bacterium]|jgi:NitT/TauT family transport system permease protein|nr:ABC transporter permease subunit [Planctomycetota bacterium]